MKTSRNLSFKKGGKYETLILEIFKIKKENSIKTKNLIKEVKKRKIKESLIMQLRKEFNYIKSLNGYYKDYLSKIKKLTDVYLKNKTSIQEYGDFIRSTYKENVEIIDKYEEKIKVLKDDKKNITKTNEGIIKMKNQENSNLNTKLLEIQTKININIDILEKLDINKKSLNNQLEEERKEFMKKEEIEDKKYKTLQTKINLLNEFTLDIEKKLNKDVIINAKEKPVELENISKSRSMLKLEDSNIKLKEEQIKNQNLLDEVKNLSSKITNISSYEEGTTSRNTMSSRTIPYHIVSLTKKFKFQKLKKH